MKRMSEVLNIRVVKNAFYDASNDSWICAFVDEEKAQRAAHAINHVDALADALEIMLSDNSTMSKWLSDNYWDAEDSENFKQAKKALAAYRGDK